MTHFSESNFTFYNRITGLIVSKRDVVIPSSLLKQDDKRQTVVGFYIQISEGFITFSTIRQSVEVEVLTINYKS